MFIEKKRKGVSPRLFTVNGNANGLITVADASDFFVKQIIHIFSSTQTVQQLEIKRFVSNNSFKVGPKGHSISTYSNLNAFLVSEGASISAPEQDRPGIKPDEINRAVYAEEPIVAKRSILVDENGNYYNNSNPIPVNASVSIGDVTIGTDGYNTLEPDSMNITGSVDGSKTGQKYGFVNNLRQQILAAHDVVPSLTYADFGTKDQRITRIEYTSATFPGVTVRRDINYVLDSGRYKKTTMPWSIV